MTQPATADILNELLNAEQGSVGPRLFESTLFVSRLAVEDLVTVRKIARECRDHCGWLTELILDLGHTPWPRVNDPRSADLHFQELRQVLSRLTADLEDLIRKYTLAAARVTDEPRATPLITRIIERYRGDVAAIQKLRDHHLLASRRV